MADSQNLILTGPVSPPLPLELSDNLFAGKQTVQRLDETIKGFSGEQKRKVARDFESVLLEKVLDQMKETIGQWGFEQDGASEQIHSLFWLYLARGIAEQGGLGLWKEVYKWLNESSAGQANAESINKSV